MAHIGKKIIGLLFGFGLFGFGVYLLLRTAVPYCIDWYTMQSWQPIEVEILSVARTETSISASYRYWHDNTMHQGNRVYVATFGDNIGNYHTGLYAMLQKAYSSKEPIAAWFNPEAPEQAVIDNSMRWGLLGLITLFCTIFAAIGAFITLKIITARNRQISARPTTTEMYEQWEAQKDEANGIENYQEYRLQRLDELDKQARAAENDFDETGAWQYKQQWRSKRVLSDAGPGYKKMWGFAIFWNAVTIPVLFQAYQEFQHGNTAALFVLIFPAAGIFLLYKAIMRSLEYRRFGVIECIMDPYPGAIGGHLGGTFDLAQPYSNRTAYEIELACVYSYQSGSGDDRRRLEDIKWAQRGTAKVTRTAKGVRLSFRFDIPDDLPEASIQQHGDYHFWRLQLKADLPGIDLDRSYNLPVFATGERSRYVDHDISRQHKEGRQRLADKSRMAIEKGAFDQTALAKAVRIEKRDRELLLYFPMFRNIPLTVFALIFTSAFGFAAYSILKDFGGGGLFGAVSIIMAVPFAAVSLAAAIAAIYLPTNNLKVTIGRGKIRLMRRLLFLPVYYKQLLSRNIRSLSIKRRGSSGKGANERADYTVLIHTSDGTSHTIAEDIEGEDLANQLMEFLKKRIKSGY